MPIILAQRDRPAQAQPPPESTVLLFIARALWDALETTCAH